MVDLLPGVALIRAGRRWQGWLAAIVVVALGAYFLWQFSDGRWAAYQARAVSIERTMYDFHGGHSLAEVHGNVAKLNIISEWLWPLWALWLVWAASLFSVRTKLVEHAHRPEFRCVSAILCPGIVVAYAGKENGALLRYLGWSLLLSYFTVVWFSLSIGAVNGDTQTGDWLVIYAVLLSMYAWFLVLPMIGIYIALSAFKRTVYPIPQQQAAR